MAVRKRLYNRGMKKGVRYIDEKDLDSNKANEREQRNG